MTPKSVSNFRIALLLFSFLTSMLFSCKHDPEEIVVIDPIDPVDTIIQGITCSPDTVYFKNVILPLLVSSCGMSGCHDQGTAEEDVILTSYQSIISTGEIVPGNPGRSKLYEAITDNDPEERMPPPPNAGLTTDQILSIRKWIEQGARNNYCDAECDTNSYAYATSIQPLIEMNCKGCHNATQASGGVRLDNYASVKSVADNGSLFGAVSHQSGYTAMPQGGKLPDCNIIQIRKWIASGAPEN